MLTKKNTGMNAIMAMPRMRFSTPNARLAKIRTLISGAALDGEEHDQQQHAGGDARLDGRVAPAPDGRLLEPEHAQPYPGDDQGHAAIVQGSGAALVGWPGDDDQRQGDQGDG